MMEKMGIKVDEKTESGIYTSSPYCFSINVAHEITIEEGKIIEWLKLEERGEISFKLHLF